MIIAWIREKSKFSLFTMCFPGFIVHGSNIVLYFNGKGSYSCVLFIFLLFPCQTCKDNSIQPHTSAGACSCRANVIEMNGNVNSDFNSEVCQGSNQHRNTVECHAQTLCGFFQVQRKGFKLLVPKEGELWKVFSFGWLAFGNLWPVFREQNPLRRWSLIFYVL